VLMDGCMTCLNCGDSKCGWWSRYRRALRAPRSARKPASITASVVTIVSLRTPLGRAPSIRWKPGCIAIARARSSSSGFN